MEEPTEENLDQDKPVASSTEDIPVASSAQEELHRELEVITAVAPDVEATLPSLGTARTAPPLTMPAPPLGQVAVLGSLIGEKYELVRLIAEGGMGKVYLARHVALRMPVAVKIMHDHIASNAEHVERFRREALAASHLGHPNIVKVLDFGKLGETFYIVMEYIDGESLGDWLDDQADVPPLADVAPILLQTLDALIEAHEAGIVHRDLKPDNILLVRDAIGSTRVKIVDFGLARFRDPAADDNTITHADAVAGTPAYMSPEQCRSLNVSHSTDLYAWGCILTEMLQLQPPFSGDSVMDVISKHMFAPVPELNRPPEAERIPMALERLRRELLAKTPSQRPRSARIVRERLVGALQWVGRDESSELRKSQLAPGNREERLPEWNRTHSDTKEDQTSSAVIVEYRRLGTSELAVDPMGLVGLSSLGFELRELASVEPVEPGRIVLLDAGTDPALAVGSVRSLRESYPDAKYVVCLTGLTPEVINTLIEAGADDVVRGPVTSDVLAHKLGRLARRR